ncbi:hypothetical protein Cgig2_029551 [Carnegiea gigantea]|uniref:Uncharacterized protein n=1 Tax=Carnegiea gigantea TaxID=171969 RepID=A0A9Q1KLU4_9CARY|nr:hypothetical protein Cgig2_029551 [Carnegiea gigantea]
MRSSTEAEVGAASSIFSTPRWPSSRRTHSLSSSSFSSASLDSLPPSPATPLRRYTAGGGRIPFSWESIPGIPKNNQIIAKVPTNIDFPHDHSYLPLPPAAKSSQKSNYENATRRGRERDPFFAALVECSKGGGNDDGDKDVFGSIWKGAMPKPIGRSLFMSCKNASDVAESLVLIPRGGGRRTRRIGYEMTQTKYFSKLSIQLYSVFMD